MKHLQQTRAFANAPWFESWFDSEYYHNLYQHRNQEEAAAFVYKLLHYLSPSPESFLLDVGCGNGRHSRYLASKGFTVDGFDLSEFSLREAYPHASSQLRFFRQDMRQPFGSGDYDLLFSFFTAFGYFEDFADNEKVIRNMAEALKPGGKLVLDYLNENLSVSNMITSETKNINGVAYSIDKWADPKFIYKRIQITDQKHRYPLEFTEQVARLDLVDFYDLTQLAGLKITAAFGDYRLQPFNHKTSPRLIFIAEKN